jgi:hypothetical protein
MAWQVKDLQPVRLRQPPYASNHTRIMEVEETIEKVIDLLCSQQTHRWITLSSQSCPSLIMAGFQSAEK